MEELKLHPVQEYLNGEHRDFQCSCGEKKFTEKKLMTNMIIFLVASVVRSTTFLTDVFTGGVISNERD